jgi:hypothetical protein
VRYRAAAQYRDAKQFDEPCRGPDQTTANDFAWYVLPADFAAGARGLGEEPARVSAVNVKRQKVRDRDAIYSWDGGNIPQSA